MADEPSPCPVEVDIEIPVEDGSDAENNGVEVIGDGKLVGGAEGGSNVSGTVDLDSISENSTRGETFTSDQLAKSRKHKRNRSLALPLSKFFDEKAPSKKKMLKAVKQIANVREDGTVEIEVPEDVKPPSPLSETGVGYSKTLGQQQDHLTEPKDLPPLQIVMLIVGTRGDVQPFVAIGKQLQEHGHRVRLATHINFKEFVQTSGLEFFKLGGDPKALAGYMVKNKGFLPSDPSEIALQRQQIKDIVESLLPACVDPDPDSNVRFEPDAIIANPPAYGHTHVAEALNVPLHVFFTMPWTPTSEFPHPLSRVKQPVVANRLSYYVVDSMIWLGMRDIINDFRKKKLKLRPVSYLRDPSGCSPDLPYGYIWSPHLVPKPKGQVLEISMHHNTQRVSFMNFINSELDHISAIAVDVMSVVVSPTIDNTDVIRRMPHACNADWGPEIDVVGFCFLDLASNYEPPETLVKWLAKDERKPIYIGFGSLPVQEPERMTQIILQSLEKTGQRGIINRGWGGLGNMPEQKDFVYLLDNCPHDWLFLQCAAVVHHGGAGTTAAGLKAACPTTIVPFFGDQPFWGERVHARGVGPPPIPVEEFSLNKLVNAIKHMLDPEVKQRAIELASLMGNEDGVTGAVKAFHKHYPDSKAQLQLKKAHNPSNLSISRCCGRI